MIGIDHAQGAQLRFLQPPLFHAWHVAATVYEQYDEDAILTSGVDGEHSDYSLHYLGLAIDLRTRNLTGSEAASVSNELSKRLGPEFKVILEPTHLHISLRPQKPINYDKWAP